MEVANYLVSITTKRKELEVVHDLSLSSLPKKIKLEHANFPQFLEEEEDSPVAILYSVKNKKVPSFNYNINHEMELMDEDEDEPSASFMEVENKSEYNQHQCMLPQVPQKRSAYIWSGNK
ncbi:hypothetical protein FCM35_KLT08859 [Carex littledalei]|uniref:Uncharacterized protein n=1 Tax=Carex littledalei TaxID=544730 RepID=A0A833QMR3_9POAL|nr:hypothetical protein FCM35_KLT08859 [Carex littledalei]